MFAYFNGTEIPKIQDIRVSRVLIGDRDRTAGGKLRQDIVADGVKRVWTIKTHSLTATVADGVLAAIANVGYGEGDFWIKGFGTTMKDDKEEKNTIKAIVRAEDIDEKFVAFGEDGVWHNDGRQLTLVIEEV